MGNPNANNLEESASTPAVESVKGKVKCDDPFCRCHEKGFHSGHCGDCGVLPTISVTLGLALPDRTWVDRKVEFQADPEFEEDESFDLLETSAEHLVAQNQDEMDKLAPSGWFLISWEWKN